MNTEEFIDQEIVEPFCLRNADSRIIVWCAPSDVERAQKDARYVLDNFPCQQDGIIEISDDYPVAQCRSDTYAVLDLRDMVPSDWEQMEWISDTSDKRAQNEILVRSGKKLRVPSTGYTVRLGWRDTQEGFNGPGPFALWRGVTYYKVR